MVLKEMPHNAETAAVLAVHVDTLRTQSASNGRSLILTVTWTPVDGSEEVQKPIKTKRMPRRRDPSLTQERIKIIHEAVAKDLDRVIMMDPKFFLRTDGN